MKALVLLAAVTTPAMLGAQDDARLQLTYPLDQRVRVTTSTAGAREVTGQVARVDSTHLSLRVTSAGTVASVPLSSISAIALDRGIDRRKGLRRGALVGLGLGTYFFATEYREIREYDYFGVGAAALGLVSFVITPGIGAAIGYAIAPRDWGQLAVPAARGTATGPDVRFAADEHVRLHTRNGMVSGRVVSQTRTLVTVSTRTATVPVPWSDVQRTQIRGGKDRVKGATAGALLFIGLGILGEQTAPTTSTSERIGAFTGAALVGGYLGSKWLAPRGWSDVPVVTP